MTDWRTGGKGAEDRAHPRVARKRLSSRSGKLCIYLYWSLFLSCGGQNVRIMLHIADYGHLCPYICCFSRFSLPKSSLSMNASLISIPSWSSPCSGSSFSTPSEQRKIGCEMHMQMYTIGVTSTDVGSVFDQLVLRQEKGRMLECGLVGWTVCTQNEATFLVICLLQLCVIRRE